MTNKATIADIRLVICNLNYVDKFRLFTQLKG